MKYAELPKSKREAVALGANKYFDGKPCRNGHTAPRYITGSCQTCTVVRAKEWNARNPGKSIQRLKRWYEENREQVRANSLRSKRKQMGIPEPLRPKPAICECCGRAPVGINQMHLDHDHITGKFRGWLCGTCNRGIGSLGDTIAGLRRALEYLIKNNAS